MAVPGATLATIRTAVSQEPALGQGETARVHRGEDVGVARRVDHDRVASYAEMFHHLEPGELLSAPPQGHWERDWVLADPDCFTP